jgi:hypothetical protein
MNRFSSSFITLWAAWIVCVPHPVWLNCGGETSAVAGVTGRSDHCDCYFVFRTWTQRNVKKLQTDSLSALRTQADCTRSLYAVKSTQPRQTWKGRKWALYWHLVDEEGIRHVAWRLLGVKLHSTSAMGWTNGRTNKWIEWMNKWTNALLKRRWNLYLKYIQSEITVSFLVLCWFVQQSVFIQPC